MSKLFDEVDIIKRTNVLLTVQRVSKREWIVREAMR